MTKPILNVLAGNEEKNPPIWFMRQAGRHLPEYMELRGKAGSFLDFCYNPEMAAEATLQPIRRYKMDAAILFADILLIPQALGRHVEFVKGKGPVLEPILPAEVDDLHCENAANRLGSIYNTVKLVSNELDDQTTLIGFCGGPWTVATYMIEGAGSPDKEVAKRFALEHPKQMVKLLNALADASADYLIEQAKAGAEVVKIFESWGNGLSPNLFDMCVVKPTTRMVKRFRASGLKTPIIGFPRGAGLLALGYVKETGINALAIGTEMPLRPFRALVGDDLPLQGNLDPLALRIGGTVLKDAVARILDEATGPHIFNLGHGVSPDVKPQNVAAVVNHIRTGRGDYV